MLERIEIRLRRQILQQIFWPGILIKYGGERKMMKKELIMLLKKVIDNESIDNRNNARHRQGDC